MQEVLINSLKTGHILVTWEPKTFKQYNNQQILKTTYSIFSYVHISIPNYSKMQIHIHNCNHFLGSLQLALHGTMARVHAPSTQP